MIQKCTRCKKELPITDFYVSRVNKNKSGYVPYCKECSKEAHKEWISTHKSNAQIYQQRHRSKCRLENLCYICGKIECLPDSGCRCENCWYKGIANKRLKDSSRWQELKDIAIKQNYICPYSGDTLIPGTNMSIDHILPISKNPELEFDINNSLKT